jgi:hypothetical protein
VFYLESLLEENEPRITQDGNKLIFNTLERNKDGTIKSGTLDLIRKFAHDGDLYKGLTRIDPIAYDEELDLVGKDYDYDSFEI